MKTTRIIGILFGLVLLWYTGNEFAKLAFPQIYVPVESITRDTKAYEFIMAAINTGYLFWLVKGLTALVGLMLIFNLFVPLALVVYTPLMVNHVLFSAFVNPGDLWFALVLLIIHVILLVQYRSYYKPLTQIR